MVPAHLGSRRIRRKPLALLEGRPLVAHVVERARAASAVSEVLVVTDSDEIRQAVAGLCEVVTTGPAGNGTSRCAQAAHQLAAQGRTAGIVVNVQGDQPLLDPVHIDAAVAQVRAGFDVGTVAAPLAGDPARPERVKVVFAPDGRALWFSRAAIPYGGPYWGHVGIYAFARAALARCAACPPWGGEGRERLEQLPWLAAGVRVGVARADAVREPVDTPHDLERVRRELGRRS